MLAKKLICIAIYISCVAAGEARELSFPEESFSLQTVERNLLGITVADGAVFAFLKNSGFFLRIPFNPDGKDRETRFGRLTDQRRQNLPLGLGAEWRALERLDNRFVLFDAARLATAEVDATSFQTLIERSIAWDLIRPPADRGGEATRAETAQLRAKFRQRFLATPGIKLAGMARIPASWQKQKDARRGADYLVATRIPDFPLLWLECQADAPSQCLVARYCQLSERLDIPSEAIVGFGLSEKRQLLVFGDPTRHRLLLYHWRSCYGSTRSKQVVQLPAKIKTLTALHIDADDRLWVGSDEPDDYVNASIYSWTEW